MSDLMVSSNLLLSAERGLLVAKAVVESLDNKLLEQDKKIQLLESELKKRDELLREVYVLVDEIDEGYPSMNKLRGFFYKPEIKAILEGE